MTIAKRIRRALLFMPGDSRRKIEKGAEMSVDSIIMDLEDAIALNQKEAARQNVAAALREVDFKNSEALVRINQVIPGWLYKQDILATIDAHPDGYVLPKVETGEQVHHVSAYLAEAEEAHGWAANSIKLLAIVETARGIVNLQDIVQSDRRLEAVIFGAEDLAGDIGARRTPEGREVFYAQSAVVIHAKAAGLQAIDTVFVDLSGPLDALISETRYALNMGYTGKLAIHPRQVEPIQDVFTPTMKEIATAQSLIRSFEDQQNLGVGVFEHNGKMVDMPMIRAAAEVIRRATECGLIAEEI
ncbi:CoA ester lyase [Phototrophicus methaneseepsis]|uniref:CoA ester lyase n=1 Tax=Phototrophicus methaneseepsis TaxID=2710758 RepID=A0A7S8IDH7_9CHLR|nr:CoA ester lyase [Phototrophicus methaneseepsis]QPC82605.1 CoA ester lyase [Phototrophicus methaneseepsis]